MAAHQLYTTALRASWTVLPQYMGLPGFQVWDAAGMVRRMGRLWTLWGLPARFG